MIWVVGCNGMLGAEVCRQLAGAGVDFAATGRGVDIADMGALRAFAAGKEIRAVVNCAAYTAVDRAEGEQDAARRLNEDGARNLARLAREVGATLIHVSTDYVFDGTGTRPYAEDDPVSPLGVYGATKAAGERAAAEETADLYILRTAWLYGWAGKNFVYTMIRMMNVRGSLKVVSDQRGTPTFCGTLARVILHVLARLGTGREIPRGVYHVTDEGETTWFGFAEEIRRQGAAAGRVSNAACVVSPCSTAEYPTPARRPAYSVLSKAKIRRALGAPLPDWRESLGEFLASDLFDEARVAP